MLMAAITIPAVGSAVSLTGTMGSVHAKLGLTVAGLALTQMMLGALGAFFHRNPKPPTYSLYLRWLHGPLGFVTLILSSITIVKGIEIMFGTNSSERVRTLIILVALPHRT